MKITIEAPDGMEPEEALRYALGIGFGTNVIDEGCYAATHTSGGEQLPVQVTCLYDKKHCRIHLRNYQQITLF